MVKFAPFFIMAAASLWGFDALFRTQLTKSIPIPFIIFFEHLLGFIILSPVFIKNLRWIKAIKFDTWKTLIAMTAISSVLGTMLFTQALAQSFVVNDFITPILLQKLQPIFVVGMSALLLKEKLTLKFIILAIFALIGSYLLSFGTMPISLTLSGKEAVYLLSLGAAICWGMGTILSKKILDQIEFPLATALRFFLAIPISFGFVYFLQSGYEIANIPNIDLIRFLIIAIVTGGAGAIFIYYYGLQNTKAQIATFAELMLPVVSILIAITELNPYGAPQQLTVANIVGIVILITSIILISLGNKPKEKIEHD